MIVESIYNPSKDRFEIRVNGEMLDTHYSSRHWAIYHEDMIIKVDRWEQNPVELRFLREIESRFPHLAKHFPRVIDSGVGTGEYGGNFTWILEERFRFIDPSLVTQEHRSLIEWLVKTFEIMDVDPRATSFNWGVTVDGIPVIYDLGIAEDSSLSHIPADVNFQIGVKVAV